MITILLIILLSLLFFHDFIIKNSKINNLSAKIHSLEYELKQKDEDIINIELIDPLTESINSSRLDVELKLELARTRRSHKIIGLSMLGIDELKIINNKFSRKNGDFLLKELAQFLKSKIRNIDLLGPWRGDRFLIIYSDIDKNNLIKITNKLKNEIENYKFIGVGSITVSFGLTTSNETDDEISMVNRVDKALRITKSNEKNSINYL